MLETTTLSPTPPPDLEEGSQAEKRYTANVLVLPAPDSNRYFVLPTAPLLVQRPNGDPVFSLTLLLRRSPRPEEDNIYPLIEQGILGFDLKLGVSEEILTQLQQPGQADEATYERLFAHRVRYELRRTGEPPLILTAQDASGTEARSALTATLDREQTLAVLSALEGSDSNLSVQAQVEYRVAAPNQTLRLWGSWAKIYDFLVVRLDEQGELSQSQLQQAVEEMLSAPPTLTVYRDGVAANENLSADERQAVFDSFMRLSSIVLKRQYASEQNVSEPRYRLRGRPHESFSLSYSQTVAGTTLQSRTLTAPLSALLGNILTGRDWDAFVHLVAIGGDTPSVEPVPQRYRTSARRSARRATPSNSIQLAAMQGSVKAISVAQLPQVQPSTVASSPVYTAKPLVTSQPVLANYSVQHTAVNDWVLAWPKQKLRSLPIVTSPTAPVWRDRANKSLYWYAPVLELVSPQPGDDPATSPFLFEYERQGTTASGKPALRGTVRLTLEKTMSAATRAALRNKPRSRAVPTDNLAVRLLIPFIDDKDGRRKTHTCLATVQSRGNRVTVTVELINDWVRLCYGALSQAGSQPLRLSLAYSFAAYVPVRQQDFQLAIGGKAVQTPVVYSTIESKQLAGRPHFDATQMVYREAFREVRFLPEAAQAAPGRNLAAANLSIARPVATPLRPQLQPQVRPTPVTPITRPDIVLKPEIVHPIQQVKYATRTQLRRQQQTVSFPCDRMGNFYRQKTGSTSTAIGCQDALSLGQTRYQLYDEIAELRTSDYQVYRSLQQPAQFLVVPTRYCITRRSGSEADAYAPLIILYALLDAMTPSNNRVVLDLVLQPQVTPASRRTLLEQLKAYAHAPQLLYPTEIDTTDIEYRLSLPTVHYEATGIFLQLSIETDILSWPLLQDRLENLGLAGNAKFHLPDGSSVESDLVLQLDQIWGPWDQGPIDIEQNGQQLQLTNRIERPVDIHDLRVFSATGAAASLPLDASLAAGATITAFLPQPGGEVYPTYTFPTADTTTIREVRSFIEEIDRTFLFGNQINFGNHNLVRLDIEARIRGVAGTYTAQVQPDMPIAEVNVIMPLTTFLAHHILEYRVTKIFGGETATETTDWIEHNFALRGNVIGLIWSKIA